MAKLEDFLTGKQIGTIVLDDDADGVEFGHLVTIKSTDNTYFKIGSSDRYLFFDSDDPEWLQAQESELLERRRLARAQGIAEALRNAAQGLT